ncbi:MAG: pyridoxal-phosphate dependent enzyme, partial [candidate division Zixibacteria bacterium]|nr:pyridoxal-phosphate dependent enzyme [candidate division Zixibacteria bacterium]
AANAIRKAGSAATAQGVWTASAGNMAQGVAWCARQFGVACTVVVPDHAPETKLAAIRRLGAEFIKIPFADWFDIILTGRFDGMKGLFVHPVSDPAVIAGNGTIGLEILEDLPDADIVLIPYGGGGLSCGIAAAVRALKPDIKIYACETDTAAPLSAALVVGSPTRIVYTPSFIDGIGGPTVLPEMWEMARALLDGARVTTPSRAAEAVRLLVERNRVVAEGAGAAPLAVALDGAVAGKIVCIVSGGNIDIGKLARILLKETP